MLLSPKYFINAIGKNKTKPKTPASNKKHKNEQAERVQHPQILSLRLEDLRRVWASQDMIVNEPLRIFKTLPLPLPSAPTTASRTMALPQMPTELSP